MVITFYVGPPPHNSTSDGYLFYMKITREKALCLFHGSLCEMPQK